ncbi:DUF899 family protein [Streptomyces chartreusis]
MTSMANLPDAVSREEWLAARKELPAMEKELTRARDRVNAERRRLPRLRVDKPYAFEGPKGRVGLLGTTFGRGIEEFEAGEEPTGRAQPLGPHVGGSGTRLSDEYGV